jgi:uncharacterized protein (TIGR00730 family)
MHARKAMMFERSDAFVALPGGPGTLDEVFEMLTWRQLALHDKPTVICNLGGYWNGLIGLIDSIIDAKYARPSFRDFYKVVDGIDEILPLLREEPASSIPSQPQKF